MNDQVQDLLNTGYKPVVVGPKPFRSTVSYATSTLPRTTRPSAS